MASLHTKLSILLILTTSSAHSQLLSISKDGNVGVNFAGYSASAGLGGLLSGDGAKGGLHASAGTPYGQAAGAGLGGRIADDGTSTGGLYAGATAGGGVSAGAGLGGTAYKSGAVGVVGSGASPGGATVVKTIETVPVAPVASFHFEKNYQTYPLPPKTLYVEKQPVLVEKEVVVKTTTAKPVTKAPIRIVQEVVEEPAPETVYIRKTHYRRPHRKNAYLAAGYNFGAPEIVAVPQRVRVVEKTVVPAATHAPLVLEKYVAPAPVVVQKTFVPVATPPVVVRKYVETNQPRVGLIGRIAAAGAVGGGAGAVAAADKTGIKNTATYSASATFNKNGNLFNDIFNIPISTLSAVNQLVNNIVGGTSVAVSKHVTTSAQGSVGAHGVVAAHA